MPTLDGVTDTVQDLASTPITMASADSGTLQALVDTLRRGHVVVLSGAGLSTVNPACYRLDTLALGAMS